MFVPKFTPKSRVKFRNDLPEPIHLRNKEVKIIDHDGNSGQYQVEYFDPKTCQYQYWHTDEYYLVDLHIPANIEYLNKEIDKYNKEMALLSYKRDILYRKTLGIYNTEDYVKGDTVFVIGNTISIMKTHQDYLDYSEEYVDIIYKVFTIVDIRRRFDFSFGFIHPRSNDNVYVLNTSYLVGKDLFVYKECLLKR